MRRLLLSLAVVCLVGTSAYAQTPTFKTIEGAISKADNTPTLSLSKRHRAPVATTDLASNQRILGHYDSDNCEAVSGGFGLRNFPGMVPTGIIFDEDELKPFLKGKIVSVRVAMATSCLVSRIFIGKPTDDGDVEYLYEQNVNGNAEGWNTFDLDTPYEIAEGTTQLFVGFDYKQTSKNYPLCIVAEGAEYKPTYFYLTYNGNTAWYSFGLQDYGNIALQCFVESDYYPEEKVVLSNFSSDYYVSTSEDSLSFEFDAKNFGTKEMAAGSYAFDCVIDGALAGSIKPSVALTANNQTFDGKASLAGLSTGKHYLSIYAVTPDGEAINGNTLTDSFCTYSGTMSKQKHLIEQFTSTYCTYCPLGSKLIQKISSLRDDIALVCVHGNMSSGIDPYKNTQCDTLMSYIDVSSFPSAAFDRVSGLVTDGEVVLSMGYKEEYHDQIASAFSEALDYINESLPTLVSIDIASTYDATTRKADITVSGQLSEDFNELFGNDATLTVYLTEDSLVSEQLNQGTWETNYTHNGVLRAAVGSVFGQTVNANGTEYRNTSSVTLDSNWNPDRMNIIAFISRPLANHDVNDMYLNNCEKAKLGETVSGVSNVIGTTDTVVRYYDLSGRQLSQPRRGLNIVRDANGAHIEKR